MKKLLSSSLSALSLLLITQTTTAGVVTPVYTDAANFGFNDTTTVTGVTGNSATTLGAQRKAAFEAALSFWGTTLNNSAPIRVQAEFSNTQSCDENGGTLASAGPTTSFFDSEAPNPSFSNDVNQLPLKNTLYPAALAREIAKRADNTFNVDTLNSPTKPYEIQSTFNARIGTAGCLTNGGWFYGFGAGSSTPNGQASFFETAVHELAHGLGFSTGVGSTGVKNILGDNEYFFDDVFMRHLKDNSTGKLWSDSSMTNADRAASYVDNGDLVWNGEKVTAASSFLTAGITSGKVRMFAPTKVQPGSSVSHFDTVLSPDEVMEPMATQTNVDTLTKALMCDIGWTNGAACSTTVANTPGTVAITGTAQVGQTLTAAVTDANGTPATIGYQWSAGGTAITNATANTYTPVVGDIDKTITVQATYTDNAGNNETPTSSATAVVIAASTTTPAPGDANGDGTVNVTDVVGIINMVFSNSTQTAGANCDSDPAVNVNDIVCTINKVFPTAQ